MSDVKLGSLIKGDEGRDAIHIAIAPVCAATILRPGERVGFVSVDQQSVGRITPYVGIVDPFLETPVLPGRWFYLCLFPYSITSLRHVWTHPAFTNKTDEEIVIGVKESKAQSTAWLLKFCQNHGLELTRLLEELPSGSVWAGSNEGLWLSDPEQRELIHHFENLTGQRGPDGVYFTCAC